MKKKIFAALPICAVALSAAFAAVSAGTAGFASDVYAYENLEANYSLEIVAAGENGENGFSAVYGEGVSFTFDSLYSGEKGETGIIIASSALEAKDESARKTFKVDFEGGYNYRVSAAGGTLTVEKSDFRTENYSSVTSFNGANGSVLGVYAESEGVYSTQLYMDNFACYGKDGKVTVRDRFDKRSRDNVGAIGETTKGYGHISRSEVLHSVSFLTEDGELIAKQEVSLYNNATLPEAPKKSGYTFKRWTEGYDNVTSDVKCFAVYEEGETPDNPDKPNPDNPDTPDNPEKPDEGKKGCKSSLSANFYLAIGVAAAAIVIAAIARKGGRKDA